MIFICLISVTLLACSASEKKGQIPIDYEIADVRNLPQDIDAYASSFRDDYLGKTCRDSFLVEFKGKYYAPWSGSSSITDIARSVTTMREHLQKDWYGENKRRVLKSDLEALSINCDLEHIPSMKRPAIVTSPTDLRVLPISKPFFENADNFPFDALQNASLKLNEPIRVRHVSRDGLWVFVETADTNGWVLSRDVGYIHDRLAQKWI
ncbi:MAG TPA: SH3 domain-containing protein, partial [Geobacteraceae bacterium]|nr:SH3 domain-containing protein [Geobacteraceae bacterium]